MVLPESISMVIHGIECTGGHHAGLAEPPAEHLFEAASTIDDRPVPDEG